MDLSSQYQGAAAGIINQRRRETALGRGPRNGQRTQEANPNCKDYLDYSLCGWVFESNLPYTETTPYHVVPCFSFLANSGQCNLMNILAATGIWVPCAATCGSCEWFMELLNS